MTNEQINIAIAEACGWTITEVTLMPGLTDVAILPPGVSVSDEGAVWKYAGTGIPDFVNDLNACSEMEKRLATDGQIEAYLDNLTDACGGDTPVGVASFTAYFATARQRCEAFLRTLEHSPDASS
jgi:hypothetical protein